MHSAKPVTKDMLGITGEPKARVHHTSYKSIKVSTASLPITKMMNRTAIGNSNCISIDATTAINSS